MLVDFVQKDIAESSLLGSLTAIVICSYLTIQNCIFNDSILVHTMAILSLCISTELPGCGSASVSKVIYCRAPAAFIASPGYPATMQPADRRWIIEGQIGEYVILDFVDLDIWHEDENNIVLCSNNYVIVDDVALNGQRTEKGRYCSADTIRKEVKSSWHMIELRYLIEKSEGGTGFMAKYRIIDFVMKDAEEAADGNS